MATRRLGNISLEESGCKMETSALQMTSAPHPDSNVDGTDERQNPELLFCVKSTFKFIKKNVKNLNYH